MVEITQLDCGAGVFQDFNGRFSDTREYADGPRTITNSCYLVRHMGHYLLWDTGFAASMKGVPAIKGPFSPSLRVTVAEQLATLGVKPSDVMVVGISHMHADHTGQASLFPTARLLIGKADFAGTNDKDDPFGPWRGAGKPVTLATADTDLFGDGSVVALHLPGHTPDHLALLVRLASGPVLLSGDTFHSADARQKRGVPPFKTDRVQTVESMDRFAALPKASPTQAADRIVAGILGNEPRILIGRDARRMDILQRLKPATYWATISRRIEKMTGRKMSETFASKSRGEA